MQSAVATKSKPAGMARKKYMDSGTAGWTGRPPPCFCTSRVFSPGVAASCTDTGRAASSPWSYPRNGSRSASTAQCMGSANSIPMNIPKVWKMGFSKRSTSPAMPTPVKFIMFLDMMEHSVPEARAPRKTRSSTRPHFFGLLPPPPLMIAVVLDGGLKNCYV